MCDRFLGGLLLPVLLLIASPGFANTQDDFDAEAEAWLNGDAEARAREVNGGTLEFLTEEPAEPVHHHQNRITIRPESLETGWVQLEQCHDHLDAVPAAQIMFHPTRLRALAVASYRNIDEVRVEGSSLQLRGLRHNAQVCITAESQALQAEGDGYVLQNGPYMRNFLDGYYPMRVSMEIVLPAGLLAYAGLTPSPQPGLALRQETNRLRMETLFNGRLVTRIFFRPA